MRLSSLLIVISTFGLAAIISLVAATFSADLIEETSRRSVKDALEEKDMMWAKVHAEGLQVFLTGVAPTEANRFRAISTAGGIVDAARVIDNMQVEATADLAPPRFSVEILRNDSGIQLIGLIPESSDRAAMLKALRKLDGDPKITDFLETADYRHPEGWTQATTFALNALQLLPRAKISIEAGRVSVTAMSDSRAHRDEIEAKLRRKASANLELTLAITAPRPVITPFTLRFVKDENGARFDACSADTEDAQRRIIETAKVAGLATGVSCTIGLGVPTPAWADAVVIALNGVAGLGGGSVTFSDADITLVALEGTDQAVFDRVIGEMETSLPDVFALHSTLPEPEVVTEEGSIPEFTATLSPEGLLQLRGRLPDDLSRDTASNYARARFGSEAVHMAARLDDALPATWTLRVMAGLDALSELHNGALIITPDSLAVRGQTGDPEANARISQLLSSRLSQSDKYSIDVAYQEKLDPVAQLPTPEECELAARAVLKDQKITFEPGSGTLDESAEPIIDQIAEVLTECADVKLEIQGHTDSQGREEMNQALSQTRAQSVLNALHERRMLTSSYSAKGYGESQPIADNETEEGREANRRIEFVLVRPEPIVEETTALEEAEQSAPAPSTEPSIDTSETATAETTDAAASDTTTQDAAETTQQETTDDQN
ncbi:OmpA-OmpF porin, OOP family [Shimia gijangensis]|uniref:OmpA-OmpF porin, OOP family n=1 Tax=Shimia gijangensis TaxID=1470563 RepID=A0A1M6FAP7_9RHOB|nr:OmpA family protein [Shimia gijangensis]SHI94838.1 OmpA-OmpF porin, OOP family [Shimia gijangensis]